ncbi:hypothetical protein F5Y01DRAFT_281395 [Xylaria sp. FL0043]|nr:hypothetical protein F5Y01DRAFT_281395 [Xylaria sp. FL0043]
MGDADYFLDLSSPDPLADEVPSSVRPATVTRRTAKAQHELSSFSIPHSSARREPRAQSPRKRTFELDVGDERSPQRIRVTVEAEESLKNGRVNRKLFPPPASPTKSPRRREAITTTTVPLNDVDDEAGLLDGDVGTPRKRGRPRRTSNGTPMPRGQKRAGTPIQRRSKQARHEDEPSSLIGNLDDTSTDMGGVGSVGGEGGEETTKPKPRIKKTPRKPSGNTPVPSSQASNKSTGRKRGRPRKVPIPEEPAPLVSTGTGAQTTGDATTSPPAVESNIEKSKDRLLNRGRGEASSSRLDDDNFAPASHPPKQSNNAASSLQPLSPQAPTNIDRFSNSPSSSHQEMAENDDYMMSEDYQAADAQSDLQSVEGDDELTHHGQDTIADASDFSMIAVESLPSFQASFQASFRESTSKQASDQHEMGEETSRIINRTLDSLRRSLHTGAEGTSNDIEAQKDSSGADDQNEDQDGMQEQATMTTNHDSGRGLLSSPRRAKYVPLSRQVLVGRGNVDDSFSTIPDSILQAATPGRPAMKPTASEDEVRDGQEDAYDDSFSEVPEAVLEAATPRPERRVETPTHGSPERNEEPHQTTRSTGRRSSPDYGSSRLPTPEETSSSNAESRKAHDEDVGEGVQTQDQPLATQRTDVPSSPPILTRPRALDFGYSNLQHELNAVQERRSSSPQRQLSGKTAQTQAQTLEAPLPSARPSLSPIVRVGRTLQNVMSDNSSPERRGGNLGSPFRGSASTDHPHRSLAAGSSSPSMRSKRAINQSQLSARSPTRLDPSFMSNLDRKFGRVPRITGEVEGPPASDNPINSTTKPLRDSPRRPSPDPAKVAHMSSVRSSAKSETKMDSTTADKETSQAAQGDSHERTSHTQPPFHTTDSIERDAVGTLSTDTSKAVSTNINSHYEQPQGLHDELVQQDMDEDLSDRFEENVGDDENGGDDFDVWDIEASRGSPSNPAPVQATLQPSKSDIPSSRRSKVPSPWRRNNRRLIYKDDIASSSQIEIEESSQSEVEQYPPVPSRPRAPIPQSRQGSQRPVPGPESVQQSPIPADPHGWENTGSPTPSHDNFEEHAGLADSEEPEDMMEYEEPAASESSHGVPNSLHKDHEEPEEHEQPEGLGIPTAPEASVDVSEYSMVAQQARNTPKEQQKPKSRVFGGFDFLSFFSSPAVLPTNKSAEPTPPEPVNEPTIRQPTLEATQPKEPSRALWSAGLFPSIPHEEARPGYERRTNQNCPDPALRSTDTVADTYEPSTSVSPSPSPSPVASAAPSTPEHQNFPPIEQKRNFTPRPGQSRGSLFMSSQPESSTSRDEDSSDLQDFSDEQESSALTETSDYVRVPPREKPSQWDRNLSPTKSCFRSPLKPTTPGRLVAFSNSALSPLVEAQSRDIMRKNTNASNTILQGPPLRPTLEGKENQPHPHTQQYRNANNNSLDKTAPPLSTASREKDKSHVLPSAATTFPLSQTTWSRQHWLRLDEMLQLRRRDPLRFQQTCVLPPRDERFSSVLLGKEVVAQDARMTLEPWHLEVVEAFKHEVGGWDERVLAKRVFALVIGEEKRRAAAR